MRARSGELAQLLSLSWPLPPRRPSFAKSLAVTACCVGAGLAPAPFSASASLLELLLLSA